MLARLDGGYVSLRVVQRVLLKGIAATTEIQEEC